MKTWTKILLAVLSLVMVLSMAACQPADEPDESPADSTPVETPKPTEPETPKPTEPESSETEPPVQGGEATPFEDAVKGIFTGDLINGKIKITNGANSTTHWTGTTLDGYKIMSGNAGENNSFSAFKFPISVTEDALLKFNLKVDAGADTGDHVYILLNGLRYGKDNLYNGDHEVAVAIPAGDNEITIAYRKDETSNDGASDAAYISAFTVEKAPFQVAPISLEQVDEAPDQFADAERIEVTEAACHYFKGATESTIGDAGIIYLKKNCDYPRASMNITVDADGTYEFLFIIGCKSRVVPATGLVQIDDGQKYYLKSECLGSDGDLEYFVGLTAELTAGEHEVNFYLAEDFDDSNVKSIYFDAIQFVKK